MIPEVWDRARGSTLTNTPSCSTGRRTCTVSGNPGLRTVLVEGKAISGYFTLWSATLSTRTSTATRGGPRARSSSPGPRRGEDPDAPAVTTSSPVPGSPGRPLPPRTRTLVARHLTNLTHGPRGGGAAEDRRGVKSGKNRKLVHAEGDSFFAQAQEAELVTTNAAADARTCRFRRGRGGGTLYAWKTVGPALHLQRKRSSVPWPRAMRMTSTPNQLRSSTTHALKEEATSTR